MRSPYTQLFIHLVWATWDRLPLIHPDHEPRLYSAIFAKCEALNCKTIAVNGVEDHIHVLLRISTTVTVADLVKNIKGSTSHLMNHEIAPEGEFKWQGAYGAFSISKTMLDKVANYVRNQKQHHKDQQLIDELEQCETDE